MSVLGERGVSGDSGEMDGPAVLEGVDAAQEQEPGDRPAAVDGPASLDPLPQWTTGWTARRLGLC